MSPAPGAGGHAALPDLFARAVDAARAAQSCSSLAIAFSGGLDSAVLLRVAAGYCVAHGLALHAFHIHHGLSPNADAWLAHCAAHAAAVGAHFAGRRVEVARGGEGTEASARKARYAALGALCVEHACPLLLTAHHLDDQAETVLLQLLRGAGPAGLSGMDAFNRAPTLLGTDAVLMARPLLVATRARLEAWARAHQLAWVEDESNADPRHARNALRHGAMPALAQAFPGYQERIARAAAHAAAAQRLLDELAAQDLAACQDGSGLDCARLAALSTDRANNLLRHWFHQRALAMPSSAWLAQMRAQVLTAADDAQVLVTHPQCEVHRHRGRIYLTPRLGAPADPVAFRWQGEGALAFPAFGGTLHVDAAAQGLDPDWLRATPLTLGVRAGGERLKLAPNRPTRSLKQHFQALDVPPWERARLPVVRTRDAVVYAAGIGLDCRCPAARPGVLLRWEPTR